MPFTRHPLAYPFPRLLFRVLTDLHTWVDTLQVPPEERPQFEQELADLWGLPEAVSSGLLRRYQFRWSRRGFLQEVVLRPGPAHRREPGIALLKRLFRARHGLDVQPRKKSADP